MEHNVGHQARADRVRNHADGSGRGGLAEEEEVAGGRCGER